jgi:hypothetical protein
MHIFYSFPFTFPFTTCFGPNRPSSGILICQNCYAVIYFILKLITISLNFNIYFSLFLKFFKILFTPHYGVVRLSRQYISILSLDVYIVAACCFLYVRPLLWLRFAPCLYVVLSTSVWYAKHLLQERTTAYADGENDVFCYPALCMLFAHKKKKRTQEMNNGEILSVSAFITPDIAEEYYLVLTGLHLNLLCQFIFGKLYMTLK